MKTLFLALIVLFLFNRCAKEVDAPLWITIEPWTLNENPFAATEQGEMTQNITEAWVNVNNKVIGVFELPAKIPIIGDPGYYNFILIPGVNNNGINATKIRYPFLKQWSATISLAEGDTAIAQPQTEYQNNLTFFIEDFEDPLNLQMDSEAISNASLVASDDDAVVKYGNYCGHIALSSQDSLYIGYTDKEGGLVLPKGEDVFLEVDYYTTNPLLTSVLGIDASGVNAEPHIQINAQENPEWNKIYIDLKEIVSVQDANVYQIGFSSLLEDLSTTKDVYIDNIKVIY